MVVVSKGAWKKYGCVNCGYLDVNEIHVGGVTSQIRCGECGCNFLAVDDNLDLATQRCCEDKFDGIILYPNGTGKSSDGSIKNLGDTKKKFENGIGIYKDGYVYPMVMKHPREGIKYHGSSKPIADNFRKTVLRMGIISVDLELAKWLVSFKDRMLKKKELMVLSFGNGNILDEFEIIGMLRQVDALIDTDTIQAAALLEHFYNIYSSFNRDSNIGYPVRERLHFDVKELLENYCSHRHESLQLDDDDKTLSKNKTLSDYEKEHFIELWDSIKNCILKVVDFDLIDKTVDFNNYLSDNVYLVKETNLELSTNNRIYFNLMLYGLFLDVEYAIRCNNFDKALDDIYHVALQIDMPYFKKYFDADNDDIKTIFDQVKLIDVLYCRNNRNKKKKYDKD